MIRFHFELTPLDGSLRSKPYWFVLTDGTYGIRVGDQEVLEPVADYYVARLWEDLALFITIVLEPVPEDLVPFAASEPEDWAVDPGDLSLDGSAMNAVVWHSEHYLDLGYLRRPPLFRVWRAGDLITVRWQQPAGAAQSATMPAAALLDAVRQLNAELMKAMDERVTELERTEPDTDWLRKEHRDRTTWLAQRLRDEPRTDWDDIRAGVRWLI
jgi:hypothetical protein